MSGTLLITREEFCPHKTDRSGAVLLRVAERYMYAIRIDIDLFGRADGKGR
jgi:hypothetical protein